MIAIELLILIGLIAFLGYPIYKPETVYSGMQEGDEYHKLLYRKESSLLTIKDLEFEFQTGKIDEEDYIQLKNTYETDAINLMKEIDTYKSHSSAKTTSPTTTENKEDVKNFCSSCGKKLDESARFCSGCGTKVS